MGCDIHTFVEIRKGDTWRMVKRPRFSERDYSSGEIEKNSTERPFDWRNYGMFGILANVRWDDVEPISQPKGLPEDMSKGVKKNWDAWDGDGHSCSYFTAKELIEFDFFKPLKYDTYTEGEEVVSQSYRFGNTFGRKMVCVEKIQPIKGYKNKWPQTYKAFLGDIFFIQLDELCALAKNPEDVRLVFWFDN